MAAKILLNQMNQALYFRLNSAICTTQRYLQLIKGDNFIGFLVRLFAFSAQRDMHWPFVSFHFIFLVLCFGMEVKLVSVS